MSGDLRSKSVVPTLSDEYIATMIAMGPGLLVCPLLQWLWAPESFFPGLLVAPLSYGSLLIVFLPGIPTLGLCISRAFPRNSTGNHHARGMTWLAASVVAPWWHLGLLEASSRLAIHAGWFSAVQWRSLMISGGCTWATTLVTWIGHVKWTQSRERLSPLPAIREL
jgi:hypothetical protein